MKKVTLVLFLLFLSSPSHAQTGTKISQMPPASTLSGTELLPLVQGGVNVRTTPAGVAALAGTGPNTPNTLAGFNGSGVFSNVTAGTGLNLSGGVLTATATSSPAFYVTAYGAVCDGAIIPGGIQTTNGSPNISLGSGLNYTNSFGAASTGSKIVLSNPAQFNTPTPPSTNLITTLLSVSGTSAVLATNATFTSSTYQFASAHIYKTENSAAIQAAFNAGNATGYGGEISFPTGWCAVNGPIIFYTNQTIKGTGPTNSGMMLANGSNSDLLQGFQFASLTGTDVSGLSADIFEDFGLDGNKGANTGSGSGTSGGTGDGIRFYGSEWYMNRVFVNNFASDGLWTEWNGGAGDPLNTVNSLNCYGNDMQMANNNGLGWAYAGCHDGTITNVTLTNNNAGGISMIGFGTPLNMALIHGYQNANFDLSANTNVHAHDSSFEGEANLLPGTGPFYFTDVEFGVLKVGVTSGAAPFGIQCDQCLVGTLNNASGAGNKDIWINSVINSFTGNAYAPYAAYGTQGLTSYVYPGSSLAFHNGASFPVGMQTSTSSVFTITNGNAVGSTATNTGINLDANTPPHVGIGTSSTASSEFGIYGGVSIGTPYFGTAAPTNGAIIQGSLGIGTANPTAKLTVTGLGTSAPIGTTAGAGTVCADSNGAFYIKSTCP